MAVDASLQAGLVKSMCPKTLVAAIAVENAGVYSSTRLLLVSRYVEIAGAIQCNALRKAQRFCAKTVDGCCRIVATAGREVRLPEDAVSRDISRSHNRRCHQRADILTPGYCLYPRYRDYRSYKDLLPPESTRIRSRGRRWVLLDCCKCWTRSPAAQKHCPLSCRWQKV